MDFPASVQDTGSVQSIENGETVFLEGMTSVSALIQGIRSGVNQRKILRIWFETDKIESKIREFRFLQAVSKDLKFSVIECSAETIEAKTSGTTHGGIVAECSDRPLPFLSDALRDAESGAVNQWVNEGFLILPEGVEDPYNFGYMLRTVYAAGASGILLPPRNWMSAAGVVARSSAGTSELLPMAIAEPSAAVRALKERKNPYRIICAGIRDSVSLYEANLKKPLVLVIGGEKRGISRGVLEQADQIVRIDYGRPFKGSLSAASATAVMAFEVLRQNAPDGGIDAKE